MSRHAEAMAISARTISAVALANAANAAGQPGMPPPIPTPASSASQRRSLLARRLQQPDLDSDEDLGSSADEEEQMMRYMDEFGANHSHFRTVMAEDHIRAAQVLRGQLSNRRVASKQALTQLQSVELDSLAESERSKPALLLASSVSPAVLTTAP